MMDMFSSVNFASSQYAFTSLATLMGTWMFFYSVIDRFIPTQLRSYIKKLIKKLMSRLQPPKACFTVSEYEHNHFNELYESIQMYLGSTHASTAKSFRLTQLRGSKSIVKSLDVDQKINETFDRMELTWTARLVSQSQNSETRQLDLKFDHKFVDKVYKDYIPKITAVAEEIRLRRREKKLYTNKSSHGSDQTKWSSVPLQHPATFSTIAMDPVLKQEIIDDLTKFVQRREYFKRVGRSWKRGYLLYGPPGTGKTSLIAAIANFLEYHIYDIELTAIKNNSQLRKLLISTSKKSVIVIEDIDCSMDLSDRDAKRKKKLVDQSPKKSGEISEEADEGVGTECTMNLSGVLNFIDGLWSSCGEEKLMIFTTNFKDSLDPALLRPGRMDKQIELSYCQFPAFKLLAKNYLGIESHSLMEFVEKNLDAAKLTPADIAETFMGCNDDVELGMMRVVDQINKRLLYSEAAATAEEADKKGLNNEIVTIPVLN